MMQRHQETPPSRIVSTTRECEEKTPARAQETLWCKAGARVGVGVGLYTMMQHFKWIHNLCSLGGDFPLFVTAGLGW